jgi:hypothetical protein
MTSDRGDEIMKNLGPKSTEWLAKVTLNLLWGLQAALLDLPCTVRELPPEFKEELRKQVEGL